MNYRIETLARINLNARFVAFSQRGGVWINANDKRLILWFKSTIRHPISRKIIDYFDNTASSFQNWSDRI